MAELLSMNLLMAGMMPTMMIIAYPMNWWLVANHLKHGMMTVRPASGMAAAGPSMSHMSMPMETGHALRPPIAVMALLSFLALAAGLAIAVLPWAR